MNLKDIATGCPNHFTVIKSSQTFDALGDKPFDEMNLRDKLRIVKSTGYVDYDTLKVVGVYEKFLGWNIVALPKEIYFFAYLMCAAIVDPLKLAHW